MSVPDDLCPRCGAQKDEGDTMCIDCIFENAPDTQAEIARLTAALAQSRAETQAALAGCAAQCCMCGKKDLSTAEDGGPECELADGRWVCSSGCYERAIQPDTSKLALVRAAFGNLVNHDAFQDEEYLSEDLVAKLTAARAALALITAQEGE